MPLNMCDTKMAQANRFKQKLGQGTTKQLLIYHIVSYCYGIMGISRSIMSELEIQLNYRSMTKHT